MKRIRMLFAGVCAGLCASSPTIADDFVIGLGSIPNSMKPQVIDGLISLAKVHMLPGDSLIVMDASRRRLLAEATLGFQKRYEYSRVRFTALKPVLKAARDHMENPPTDAVLSIPAFVEYAALNRRSNKPRHILLIGDALNRNPRHPELEFTDGFFPSDGHINASGHQSPFSTANKNGFLAGTKVHILHTGSSEEWLNSYHRERIVRFMQLYTQSMGGSLPTFTSDPATAINRLGARDTLPLQRVDFDETLNKVTMLRVPSQFDVKMQDDPLWTLSPTATPPQTRKGLVKLGIRWDCTACDIDVYAKASSHAPWLFFGHARSEEGRFLKDWQQSPDTTNGLEIVEFTREVDLAEIRVLINFYSGQSRPGPSGVLRVFFGGKVYEATFTIAAHDGNKGRGGRNAATSPHWVVVDMREVFNITTSW